MPGKINNAKLSLNEDTQQTTLEAFLQSISYCSSCTTSTTTYYEYKIDVGGLLNLTATS